MYFTGSAAGDYDAAPFDERPASALHLRSIVAAAESLGHANRPQDVLDLGCGAGRLLAEAASHVEGRIVGVDASGVTCDLARQVLQPWADRAEIIHATFEDLDPAALGEFDVIYCIGALYTVSETTRATLLDLIARCLRPGGLIVMTYYAGTRGHIHKALTTRLKDLAGSPGTMLEAVARARAQLSVLKAYVKIATTNPAVSEHIDGIARYGDITVAHEVFGHGIEVLGTGLLNQYLQPCGVNFLGYIGFDPSAFLCEPNERVFRAETLDLLDGGYRFAIFARPRQA